MTDAHVGLADALSDERTSVAGVTQRLDAYNLDVIPAGMPRAGISQILRSPRLDAFLKEARQRYAYIVVDTPPLLPVFDSALLAKSVDGVLMVVSANRTPRKLLGEALNLLDASAVLGIVFNRDERPLFGYYNAYCREYFPGVSHPATEA
jgi:Mrp family chromosome partitioning ATPase